MLAVSSTDRVFTLAGAGVSAESGIPTFRDVGGLWRNYRIEEVASPEAWNRDPRLVWEFYSMRRRVLDAAFAAPPRSGLAWFCFLSPLIEPDRQISRIRLSEKTHDLLCDAVCDF